MCTSLAISISIISNMLPKQLFKPHEPRNVYPVFAECQNRLSYIFRDIYVAKPHQALRFATKSVIERDKRASIPFLSRVLLDSLRGIRMRFRGAYLDRDGHLICEFPELAEVSYRQSFDLSVNDLLREKGIPVQDGQFLMIADRGLKLDSGLSTGTLTATYINNKTFTCYRNAIFARPVNDFAHHKPRGFRSIAPHMFVSGELDSYAFFCNFSSDAAYDRVANPKVRLYRDEKEFLEGNFGNIPAFGAAERSMRQLFGDEVEEFLKSSDGCGTLVAEEASLTLSSIHLIRNRRAGTMSIEHTRPTHMYVV